MTVLMVFSKRNSVQTQSQLILLMSYYPLYLEVDLDAEIRSKKLSSIEEIRKYVAELSNTKMQDLRVRNNNGAVWIHCKYNDVRHPKKEERESMWILCQAAQGKRLWTVLS